MTFNYHGGECCGVSHVYDFPHRADEAWLNREIFNAIDEIESDNQEAVYEGSRTRWKGTFGHAIEVCLTDDQMMVWAETLKKKGFRLGLRWLNDNSGNYCNLLSWAPKRASKKRPYKW